MGKRHIEVIISAKNSVAKGLKSAAKSLKRFGHTSASILRKVAVVGAIAFGALGFAIKKAFDFELYREQFRLLLGSVEKATDRFKALKELAAESPFEIERLVKASKALEQSGFRAEKNLQWLKIVGDAAATLNPDAFERTAYWVGQLAIGASSGAVGRPLLWLKRLQVLSAESAQAISKVAGSGASSEVIMAKARVELSRFAGGMELLAKTGHGAASMVRDNWILAVAAFGEELRLLATDTLLEVKNKLKELREDGSITKWAAEAAEALSKVKNLLFEILDPDTRTSALETLGKGISGMFRWGAAEAVDFLINKAPEIGRVIGETAVAMFPALGKVQRASKVIGKVSPYASAAAGGPAGLIPRLIALLGGRKAAEGSQSLYAEKTSAYADQEKEAMTQWYESLKQDPINVPAKLDRKIGIPAPPNELMGDVATTGLLSAGDLFERIYSGRGGVARDEKLELAKRTAYAVESIDEQLAGLTGE